MTSDNNPYGASYGGTPVSVSWGDSATGKPDGISVEGLRAGAAPGAAELIRDTTTAAFKADVMDESRRQPVLVDFWAPWCGPCKQLAPALEKAVVAAKGKVKLVKMNIDDHPAVAGQLGIQSIPAVIAFVGGQPVDGFMGAVPESQIKAFIDRIAGAGGAGGAPDPLAEAMEAATAAAEAGDRDQAAQIYQMILQADPENADALGALAALYIEMKQFDAARQTLAGAAGDALKNPSVIAARTRLELAEEVAKLGDPDALRQQLNADPKDFQARFDLAMIENAIGDRDAAAENLLRIVRADRAWQDDGARKQLLKFFDAWGPKDPATLAGRRKLSSALFS